MARSQDTESNNSRSDGDFLSRGLKKHRKDIVEIFEVRIVPPDLQCCCSCFGMFSGLPWTGCLLISGQEKWCWVILFLWESTDEVSVSTQHVLWTFGYIFWVNSRAEARKNHFCSAVYGCAVVFEYNLWPDALHLCGVNTPVTRKTSFFWEKLLLSNNLLFVLLFRSLFLL